jgi:mono/diheme cytochrome c family protein
MLQRRCWPSCALVMAFCIGCRQPSAENGAAIFRKNCAGCHATQAGRQRSAPSLTGYFERNPRPSLSQTRRKILDGGLFMPPFRERLSSDEIDDVIAHMKTLR